LRRSTQKCLRYQSTKLEFIVSSKTIFENCWSISRRKTDQLDQNKNYDNLVSFYSPNISLSNGENRRSLAASVHEIFKKYRVAFFFGADTSYETPVFFVTIILYVTSCNAPAETKLKSCFIPHTYILISDDKTSAIFCFLNVRKWQ
jgi:hypothetical protein